jgi:hypothetical protein
MLSQKLLLLTAFLLLLPRPLYPVYAPVLFDLKEHPQQNANGRRNTHTHHSLPFSIGLSCLRTLATAFTALRMLTASYYQR